MIRKHRREFSVLAAFVLVLVILAIKAPAFFNWKQLLALGCAAVPVLLVSGGMALVIISRQIDISVGSQFGVCGIMLGLMVHAGMPLVVAAPAALILGAVFGALNGVLIAGLGLPSIVVTLATMVTWRETLRWWRQGEFVSNLPGSFQWFGLSQTSGELVVICSGLALFVIMVFAMKFLAAGRQIYAVGSDPESARLSGLRPRLITFAVLTGMGALTALAAVLNAVRFPSVDPKSGTGLELQAIAAAVVGGIAISGGRGTLWGVLAGVLLLAVISPAFIFLHLQPQWEKALQGCIILIAVAAEALPKRGKSKHANTKA
jgi:rhamnose transport system permease protein